MNNITFKNDILSQLAAFWRFKGALSFLTTSKEFKFHQTPVSYSNVPEFGEALSFLEDESLQDSLNELKTFTDERLNTSYFLIMISTFEKRLVEALMSQGDSAHKLTLGGLQKNTQKTFTNIPNIDIMRFNEIRERRNCVMHNHGLVSVKYETAANSLRTANIQEIEDPNTIEDVYPTVKYLSYAADFFISYSNHLP